MIKVDQIWENYRSILDMHDNGSFEVEIRESWFPEKTEFPYIVVVSDISNTESLETGTVTVEQVHLYKDEVSAWDRFKTIQKRMK